MVMSMVRCRGCCFKFSMRGLRGVWEGFWFKIDLNLSASGAKRFFGLKVEARRERRIWEESKRKE